MIANLRHGTINFRTIWLCVIVLSLFLSVYINFAAINYLHDSWDYDTEKRIFSIIVLKLPRSGSSWFTELLNKDSATYISKEIIQSSDVGVLQNEDMESHLRRALLHPMGKAATSKMFFLQWITCRSTQRFLEDFVLHRSFKLFRSLKVVGFTLNPEHCKGIDWKTVVAAAVKRRRQVKVVVFQRSNVVKTAVSGVLLQHIKRLEFTLCAAYRGKQTKIQCGSANLKSSGVDCVLPDRLVTNTTAFMAQVEESLRRATFLEHFVQTQPALRMLPRMVVYYEELLSSPTLTMQRIHHFLRSNPEEPVNWNEKGETFQWRKRSSDDLSSLLASYSTLKQAMALHSDQCECLHAQLVDSEAQVFRDLCSMQSAALCTAAIINDV